MNRVLLVLLVGWDLLHQVLRPLLAYCTAPDDRWGWLWSNWWNEDWQGKPKYSEKTCPSAILSTTNPTWPDPGANPGRRGGKSATNRLSYGAAMNREISGHIEIYRRLYNISFMLKHSFLTGLITYCWKFSSFSWKSAGILMNWCSMTKWQISTAHESVAPTLPSFNIHSVWYGSFCCLDLHSLRLFDEIEACSIHLRVPSFLLPCQALRSGWVGSGRVGPGKVESGRLLLVLASTVILGSESRGTPDHIFMSHNSGSLTWQSTHRWR
jgi:hypothetical protein